MKFTGLFTGALVFSSALAAPALKLRAPAVEEKSISTISTVLVEVDHLKAGVEKQLGSITSIISSGQVGDVVPAVQTSLTAITSEVQGVVHGIAPLVLGIVGPLSQGDLKELLTLVTDVKAIVDDVKAEVLELVDVLDADAISLLEEELQCLLDTLTPLVTPILTLVFSLAGNVADGQALDLQEILDLAVGLKGTLSTLLKPVTGLLNGLLGGLLG